MMVEAFATEVRCHAVAQQIQMTVQSNHDVHVLNPQVSLVSDGAKTQDLCIDSKAWLAFQMREAVEQVRGTTEMCHLDSSW